MTDAAWPMFKGRTSRVLAVLEGSRLTTEHGDVYRVPSWSSLKAAMFTGNMLIFVPSVVHSVFFGEAVEDDHCRVFIDKRNEPNSLRVHLGRSARWIIAITSWEIVPCDLSGLRLLRSFLDYCDVGDCPTPSSVGMALMSKQYPLLEDKQYVLPTSLWNVLYNELQGGRSEVMRPRELFPRLYSYDMNSAYASAIRTVPIGRPTHHVRPQYLEGKTGYWHVQWTAPTEAPVLLPLGVRIENQLSFPTSGKWEGWYWSESLRAAYDRGVRYTLLEGYSWPKVGGVFAPWALSCYSLREHAEDPLNGLIKLVIVAGIGRFASSCVTRTLTAHPVDGDCPFVDKVKGPINHWYVHEVEEKRLDLLIHVSSYVYDQCRLSLMRRAEQEGDDLVSTNFDEFYSRRPPIHVPSSELGEWKHKTLTSAIVEQKRWIRSEEKVRTPGVKR